MATHIEQDVLENVQTAGGVFTFDAEYPDTSYTVLFGVKAADGTDILGTTFVRAKDKVTFYPPENGVTINVMTGKVITVTPPTPLLASFNPNRGGGGMTTEDLLARVGGYRWSGEEKIRIPPDDILIAGDSAQNEILAELRPVEITTQLALANGQGTYFFPPQTVTEIVSATPIVLKLPGHPFNTGDEVVVDGSLGCIEANGVRICTKVDSDHISLDGSVGMNDWAGGGMVYHALNACQMVKDTGIRKISQNGELSTGTIQKKTPAEMEMLRYRFSTASGDKPVLFFSEEYTVWGVTLEFLGAPSSVIIVKVPGFRQTIPPELLSDTVNPILPRNLDNVLLLGTMYHALMLRTEKFAGVKAEEFRQKFELEKKRWLGIRGRNRLVMPGPVGGIVWR